MKIRGQITSFILVSFLLHLTLVSLLFVFGSSISRLQRMEVNIAETKASMFRLNDLIRSVMLTSGYPVATLADQLRDARTDFHQRLATIDEHLPLFRSSAPFERTLATVRSLWAGSELSVLEIEGILSQLSREGFETRRTLDISLLEYNSLLQTSEILQNRDHYLIVRARNLIDSVIIEAGTYSLILVEASEAVGSEVQRAIRLLTLMAGLSVAAFGAGVLVFGLRFSRESMVRQIDSLLEDIRAKERDKREFQVRALRYQMNPHFLFNTLNTVRHTCIAEGASDSAEMIRILSRLLRNRISSDDALTTIGEEIDSLSDYMTLMQKRYDNRLVFGITCDEGLSGWRIPRFLTQPLMENAILHGLRERVNNDNQLAELQVGFRRKGARLAITVSDNGVGMSRDQVTRLLAELPERDSDHIGVKNIHDRLELAYGPPCGLSISSKLDHGTQITITLPIDRQDGEQN